MEKVLRSFIHEKFDLDTRYEIELLTRRRDLINAERQEELIKLLQSKNVGEIIKLGPGTNRYAFKLDGFVVKVATDHDGKIDNLKEFKMAKRLYPYVAKTYEVSENGTLLVAEYIQPFVDFSEMVKHSEKIKNILQELSAVYLIGDVGLIPKNFANWGLRVGTQDPVCLDFAYVYDVSSKLFICSSCNTNSILQPTPDFSELVCSNPACLKRYTFESIRAKIGNDLHRHEIGDLSEEGYRLTESHVLTVLDEERSNYLAKLKKKDKGETAPDPDKSETQEIINKEDPDMSDINRYMTPTSADTDMITPNRIRCTATIRTKAPETKEPDTTSPEKLKTEYSSVYGEMGTPSRVRAMPLHRDEMPEKEVTPTKVAFSGKINPDEADDITADPPVQPEVIPADVPTPKPYETTPSPQVKVKPPVVAAKISNGGTNHIVTVPVPEVPKTPIGEVKVPAENPAMENVSITITESPEAPPAEKNSEAGAAVPQKKYKFSQNFCDHADQAVSKITNRIAELMHVMLVFDDVHSHIRDKKMWPATFYKGVQNAAYNSLMTYLNFSKSEKPRADGKGVVKVFTPPADMHNGQEPTFIFIERIWNMRELNTMPDSAAMLKKYRSMFNDYHGIQPEWLSFFERRLTEKMPIDKAGAAKLASIAEKIWCTTESFTHEPVVLPDVKPEVTKKVSERDPAEIKVETISKYTDQAVSGNLDVEGFNNLDADLQGEILKSVIQKGIELYPSYRPAPGSDITKLVHVTLSADGNDYTVNEIVCVDELNVIISIDGEDVADTKFPDIACLVAFLGTFNPGERIDAYSDLLTSHITSDIPDDHEEATEVEFFQPGQAAAQILGDENDEEGEEEDEEVEVLSISIYNDGDFDIVKLSTGEAFGPVEIPFYCNLDKISTDNMAPSVVDNRNGMWDWLIHMVPDAIFTTTNPERYLEVNKNCDDNTQTVKFVILDVDKNVYTVGMYFLEGVDIIDDEMIPHPVTDEITLWKVNRLIVEDIGYSRISHLQRTLSMAPELMRTEDYVLNDILPSYQDIIDGNFGGHASIEPEGVSQHMVSAEEAALSVIMGNTPAVDVQPEEETMQFGTTDVTQDHCHDPETPAAEDDTEELVMGTPVTGDMEIPPETPSAKSVEPATVAVQEPAGKKLFHPIRRPTSDV